MDPLNHGGRHGIFDLAGVLIDGNASAHRFGKCYCGNIHGHDCCCRAKLCVYSTGSDCAERSVQSGERGGSLRNGEKQMPFLFSILVMAIILGLIYWILTVLPLPEPFKKIAIVIFCVICLLYLLGLLFGMAAPFPAFRIYR